MDYSAVAVRYAKAFFSLADEKNSLELARADVNLLLSLFKTDKSLSTLIESPVIELSEKLRILNEALAASLSEYGLKFVNLVLTNGRASFLYSMCLYFIHLYAEKTNTQSVVLTTAIEVDANISLRIKEKIENDLKLNVELETKINPDLIGGFTLRIGDKQYDASIANKLNNIRTKLIDTVV